MKITRIFALAALLVAAMLGFWAVEPVPAPESSPVVNASSGSVLQLHSDDQQTPTAKAVERPDSVLQLHKAWVKERVGVMPLNIYRAETETVKELKGYGTAVYKPKLSQSKGFKGIGHNHYARADV